MKFTLSWLKLFLDTDATLFQITETLTNIGLEVESIIDRRQELGDFTVAYITETNQHPFADRLRVCTVQTASQNLQIVCGAPNARAGIQVVLASVGSVIPNGQFKIKESDIRGIKSHGMLCSASELMVGDDQDGIIELAKDAVIGEPFIKYYGGLDDPVIEINVTPNRGDALGVYGIARDLFAAAIGSLNNVKIPQIKQDFYSELSIKVQDAEVCPIFCVRELKNLKNNSSPEWLKQLLSNIGIRSVSAIIDVTNYISFSFGQPMHAYDADKISSLEVKLLEQDIEFQALNNMNYQCVAGDLVVADGEKIACLAGIIGGLDSACSEHTTNIVLEAACFNPKNIASTGRRLQIDTDSRYRFERNIDKKFVLSALDIATQMIISICGGVTGQVIAFEDISTTPKMIEFSTDFFSQYSGIVLSTVQISDILQKLGFGILNSSDDILTLAIPSWRHDIAIKEDIVEEILRIYGYDKITPCILPDINIINTITRTQKHTQSVRRIIASAGYDEVVSWSFIYSETAKLFTDFKDGLRLINPISSELDYMRPSLIPNLLTAIAKNHARSIKDMALFEIGQVFYGVNPEDEKLNIAGVKCGNEYPKNCHTTSRIVDVYDVKSDLSLILDHLESPICRCQIHDVAPEYYHPTRAASLKLGKNIIAHFGQIHPAILRHFDIDFDVIGFELYLDNVPKVKAKFGKKAEFKISNFQINTRDYSFIVEEMQPVGTILDYIKNLDKKLIKAVDLFDVYISDKIGIGKKSIALSVQIQADDRTMSEAELLNIDMIIINGIKDNFAGEIRNS